LFWYNVNVVQHYTKRGTPFGIMLHYVYIIPKQTMLDYKITINKI
jgi:hypothetical protein